ncbi:hypothetical protein HELRODRAFT_190300 [Helobdella robusta]|uniref:non-specific serine/threonine protein kinase n=1 Tax=Helobdella robusta TaxID=6412 RepID=T1FRV7_HELRO|nr:hypothetical protein HELRODRAFT_190300 [Helobdella robusta]ESO09843.1 hypothetical protein HELRODRAFT_190300 [Helobdella robusta]
MCEFLLRHGAEVRVEKTSCMSSVHISCLTGHSQCLQLLLETFPQHANQPTLQGSYPIHLVCRQKVLQVVQVLIHSLKSYSTEPLESIVNMKDSDGLTPLHLAVQSFSVEIIRYLFTLTEPTFSDETLQQTVHEERNQESDAASEINFHKRESGGGSFRRMASVSPSVVHVDDVDNDGKTALHMAVEKCKGSEKSDCLEIVKILLQNRANPNLEITVKPSSLNTTQNFQVPDRTASVATSLTTKSTTNPLFEATKLQDVELIDLLLMHGARDDNKEAIRMAISLNNDHVVGLFLSYVSFFDQESRPFMNKKLLLDVEDEVEDVADKKVLKGKWEKFASTLLGLKLDWHGVGLNGLCQDWFIEVGRKYFNKNVPKDFQRCNLTCYTQLITRLDISHNSITELPYFIFQLSNLKKLDASNNKIKEIKFCKQRRKSNRETSCSLLDESEVNDDGDSVISSSIEMTYRGRGMDEPSSSPARILQNFKNSVLEEINLQSNMLEKLPVELFKLPNLKRLNASYNSLSRVPIEVWTCSTLIELRLAHNFLTDLSCPADSTMITQRFLCRSTSSPFTNALSPFNDSKSETTPLVKAGNKSEGNFFLNQEDTAEDELVYKYVNRWHDKIKFQPSFYEEDDDNENIYKKKPNKIHSNLNASNRMNQSRLKFLDLSFNLFEEIPDGLSCLAYRLEKLILASNQLSKLGPIHCYPASLQVLDLTRNHISYEDRMPPISIPSRSQLETPKAGSATKMCKSPFCGFMSTSVSGTPPSGRLTSRSSASNLSLSMPNMFVCDHASHSQLLKLKTLSLSNNCLVSFDFRHKGEDKTPAKLSLQAPKLYFPSLLSLDMSHNIMTSVPKDISYQEELTSLNLANNKIKELPCEIGSLRKLWSLNLSGNPVEDTLKCLLGDKMRTVSSVVSYLRAIRDEAVPYSHMKLMLVGKQGIGKTSLLNMLTGERESKSHWGTRMDGTMKTLSSKGSSISTVGVDIAELVLTRQKEEIHFSTWDFGGQREYYATHQYFLSKRSIYLVVWRLTDGLRGVNNIFKWLINIQARAPNSAVIIVGTHLDVARKSLSSDALEGLKSQIERKYINVEAPERWGFPKVVGHLEVTCKMNHRPSILALQEMIWKAVDLSLDKQGVKLLDQKVPVSYVRLQNVVKIIAQKRRAINKDPVLHADQYKHEVIELMESTYGSSFQNASELNQATQFLHENGMLLHYDDTNLRGIYFLDAQWLCDMLACIVTVREINRLSCNGVMKIDDLPMLFKGISFKSEDIKKYMINLLHKFEVALQWDMHHLLLPSLLPPDKPGSRKLFAEIPLTSRVDKSLQHQHLVETSTESSEDMALPSSSSTSSSSSTAMVSTTYSTVLTAPTTTSAMTSPRKFSLFSSPVAAQQSASSTSTTSTTLSLSSKISQSLSSLFNSKLLKQKDQSSSSSPSSSFELSSSNVVATKTSKMPSSMSSAFMQAGATTSTTTAASTVTSPTAQISSTTTFSKISTFISSITSTPPSKISSTEVAATSNSPANAAATKSQELLADVSTTSPASYLLYSKILRNVNPALSFFRLYTMSYIPSGYYTNVHYDVLLQGFWPRLITRLLGDATYSNLLRSLYDVRKIQAIVTSSLTSSMPISSFSSSSSHTLSSLNDLDNLLKPNWRCWQTGLELCYLGFPVMRVKELSASTTTGVFDYTKFQCVVHEESDYTWNSVFILDESILEIVIFNETFDFVTFNNEDSDKELEDRMNVRKRRRWRNDTRCSVENETNSCSSSTVGSYPGENSIQISMNGGSPQSKNIHINSINDSINSSFNNDSSATINNECGICKFSNGIKLSESNDIRGKKISKVTFYPSQEIAVRLLSTVVEQIDVLLEDWYPNIGTRFTKDFRGMLLINRLVPCNHCLIQQKLQVSNDQLLDDGLSANSREFESSENDEDEDECLLMMRTDEKNAAASGKLLVQRRKSTGTMKSSGRNDASPASINKTCHKKSAHLEPSPPVQFKDRAVRKQNKRLSFSSDVDAPLQVVYCFTFEQCIQVAQQNKIVSCPRHGNLGPFYLAGQDGLLHFGHVAPDTVFYDLKADLLINTDNLHRQSFLGKGAFGSVFSGYVDDKMTNERCPVAIKLLQPVIPNEDLEDEVLRLIKKDVSMWTREPALKCCEAYNIARKELSILLYLQHESVVSLVGVCVSPISLILSLAPMGSLNCHLKNFSKVASALDYLHFNQIIYRDLKSDNILVWSFPSCTINDRNNNNAMFSDNYYTITQTPVDVKLADYGVSRVVLPTGTKGLAGTLPFMAPEIILHNGEEAYTEKVKVDCYSFALLMYELITLKYPYENDAFLGACRLNLKSHILAGGRPLLATWDTKYPSNLLDLMTTCWASDPHDRLTAHQIEFIARQPEFCTLLNAVTFNEEVLIEAACPVVTTSLVGGCDEEECCEVMMYGRTNASSSSLSSPSSASSASAQKAPTTKRDTLYVYSRFKNGGVHIKKLFVQPSRVTCMCCVGGYVWCGTEVSNVIIYRISDYSELGKVRVCEAPTGVGHIINLGSMLCLLLNDGTFVFCSTSFDCLNKLNESDDSDNLGHSFEINNSADLSSIILCRHTSNSKLTHCVAAFRNRSSNNDVELWCGQTQASVLVWKCSVDMQWVENNDYVLEYVGTFNHFTAYEKPQVLCDTVQIVQDVNEDEDLVDSDILSSTSHLFSYVYPGTTVFKWSLQSKQVISQVDVAHNCFPSIHPVKNGCFSITSMMVMGGRLYVGTSTGSLMCFSGVDMKAVFACTPYATSPRGLFIVPLRHSADPIHQSATLYVDECPVDLCHPGRVDDQLSTDTDDGDDGFVKRSSANLFVTIGVGYKAQIDVVANLSSANNTDYCSILTWNDEILNEPMMPGLYQKHF